MRDFFRSDIEQHIALFLWTARAKPEINTASLREFRLPLRRLPAVKHAQKTDSDCQPALPIVIFHLDKTFIFSPV